MKFKFHPLFILLGLYFVISGRLLVMAGYFIAILAHELAHNRMAKWRGYNTGTITLMPYGGVMSVSDNYQGVDNIIIALAGPVFNFVVGLVMVAMWWLVPSMYSMTLDFCIANIMLGVVNLLPCYPLDGSKVIITLSSNKLITIKILKIITIIIGGALFVLGVVSMFFTPNPTLAIGGIFLIFGGVDKSENEELNYVSKSLCFVKNYQHGLRKCTILVSKDMPLFRGLSMLNSKELVDFGVVDDDGKILLNLTEQEFCNLCHNNELTTKICECIKYCNKIDKNSI